MANKIANPAKSFNYSLEIGGQLIATCQNISIGDSDITAIDHGQGNNNISTPGKRANVDVTIQQLVSQVTPDFYAWNWFKQAQDNVTGTGQLPEAVKQTIFVKLLNGNEFPIKRWIFEGAWVKTISRGELGDNNDENYIETLTLRVDNEDEVPI
jgi:phage tail-like protein